MTFLEMTAPEQGVEVLSQNIPRARLGLHLRLGQLAEQIDKNLQAKEVAQAALLMLRYFELCKVDVSQASEKDKLIAYLRLQKMNRLKFVFPFQIWSGEAIKPPPYDYPGRFVAWWVHKLASRYGWSREQIFALWPEEAAAYLQEIMIAEYDEADERRALSELAYHYDKMTKKSTFRPLPRPEWMKERKEDKPQPTRIRKDMLPVGNIINLTYKTKDDFEIIH
jgi:hypothetical protein